MSRYLFTLSITLFAAIFASFSSVTLATNEQYAIPHTKYVLDNGLTLIVHVDKKAPIVAVNIWYHVGSKDEKPGRTGFAHLFEHLMFNGSENYNDDWFKPFDRVGATGMNGTTNQDRTNYFQVVPKNALEMTLWMESDRMGHLLGAIDQAKLDEQRDVVKNEKRQGENQPYGKVFATLLKNVYPEGHPYSWSVIGSMDDLNAASLDDVHEWFKSQYGAANATLVVAGDVEPNAVRQLAEKYFGHIDAGPPTAKIKQWVAKRTGKQEQTMYDRVPQARVYKIWNIPAWGSADADFLSIASSVLSSDKKSRLYNRLVYREQLASDVSAFSFNSEIGGLFGIVASALNENDLTKIENVIDEELARFLKAGATKEELNRIKNGYKTGLVRGLERVGGFGGKSDLLARNEVFTGDPLHYLKSVDRVLEASNREIIESSRAWLSDGEYVLRVLPFATYSTNNSTVDRSQGIPPIGPAPEVNFDTLEKFTLDNGLKVILAERDSIPVIAMRMMINAGFAADHGGKLGTANLTMQMLDEGAGKLDALEISSQLANMGTRISTSARLDSSDISLNTIKDNLDASLKLYADIVLHPTFPKSELQRLKAQQLAGIAQEKSSPFGLGYRILPKLLYGGDHAYSAPLSGSGSEASVQSITVNDLITYHNKWFKANNATLIVTGDISKEELITAVQDAFGDMPSGDVPSKNITDIAPVKTPTIYLVDRPDSAQSAIIAAKMMPSYGFDKELGLQLANEVLGASFNSRINMNLREDKGWSYGARSAIQNTQGQRPFLVRAPVQTDKTAASMLEILKELRGISGSKPAAADELARSLDKRILTLPGRWETLGSVENDIASMVAYGLGDDYWNNYVRDLKNIDLTNVRATASEYITTNDLTWLVVGDLSKIEHDIRALELGKVIMLDVDGNQIKTE